MSQTPQEGTDHHGEPSSSSKTVVVVGPDGRPIGTVEVDAAQVDERAVEEEDPSRLIEQPAKVMRIGSMIKQLLEEVKAAPLDEQARQRLTEIHRRSITELETGLAPELVDELDRLSLPFAEGTIPSDAELRMAQAQLVGWLEGLFHGIQAALVAQQMAARLQLEQMRTGRPALPVGPSGVPIIPGIPGAGQQRGDERSDERGESGRTGQYL
jgi:proteasome activator-like protein